MKTIGMLSVVVLVLSGWMTSYAQVNDPEVPGDHFSLEGALELFKKSSSPEEFEKMLNSPDSKVNNLDLNGDGYIDYIRVRDRYEGNVHAFIIQAVVSERENQDVAVIELEKLHNGKAVLQIIGDEDIYGIETIIEPTQEVRTYAGTTSNRTVVNVWAWPSVQYVYAPYYVGWDSPWGWYHRPVWYHRWRPIAYIHYYPIWRPYRPYYSICHTHRVVYAHRMYRPYRTTSVVVRERHHSQLDRYRSARREDDRNGRKRDDDRRSYSQNVRSSSRDLNQRRADSDLNRRPSTQREEISSPDRSNTRQRSVPADFRSTSPNLKRQEAPARRSVTTPNNVERRQQVTTPATASRSRSLENNEVRQPAYIQRNSAELRREEAPSRRSVTIPNDRETRQHAPAPSVNRSRSIESPNMQRSGNVNNNREIRQQPTRSSTVDRRASSPNVQQRQSSPSVHQRQSSPSGGTRSIENKRGRQ